MTIVHPEMVCPMRIAPEGEELACPVRGPHLVHRYRTRSGVRHEVEFTQLQPEAPPCPS